MPSTSGASLRIALVAPLWTPVPPQTYGGAELLVHLLAEELVARGHSVTLFASGNSQTRAELVAPCGVSVGELMAAGEAHEYEPYINASFVAALRQSASFDVIHAHTGTAQIPLSQLSRCPVVHTIHAPVSPDDAWVVSRHADIPVVGVSHVQVRPLRDLGLAHVRVIHSGCDFSAYEPSFGAGSGLVFLGRMGPNKNPVGAVQVARAAGMPIVLAGAPQNRDEELYFREQVLPLVDGTRVTYVGPVDHARKNELLRQAAGLVFPITWDESFGIVMIEAMACGTPVLALRHTSVEELVDEGVDGYVGDSVDELVSLVPRLLALDRRAVREHAAKRFGHARMVDEYVRLYRELVDAADR